MSNQPKKNSFARAAHFFCTFLCHCFARRQRETSRNFPVTRSCSLFLPPICFTLLVTASISHFLTAAIKFSCYTSNKIGLLCLSLALAFSLSSTPMQTLKLSRKKESASLLLFFISKSPGGYATYCRNARVLEMRNFTPASTKGWTYVRAYSVRAIFSEPKFSGLHAYFTKFSYPWCSAARACARELSYDLSSITWTLHQNAERLN